MFKKLNPWVLLAILLVLAVAVVLILRMDARKQQGSVVRQLVNADISKTTHVVIIPEGMPENAITIQKEDGGWMVGAGGESFRANHELLDQMFMVMSPMVPRQLVSRNPDNWNEYEVSDELGTRVKVYQGKKLSDEFIVGGYQLQQQMIQGQQRPSVSTYVRLAGQEDVYTVSGFLTSVFPGRLKQYRDQTVLNNPKDDVLKIGVEGPDNNFNYELEREGAAWLLNGMPADSTSINFYLDAVSMVHSDAFVEEEAEGWLSIPSHKLIIERKTAGPIEVTAYPADTTHRFFITSSQNPGAVFSGSEKELFETIFFGQDFFKAN
jgi:hypothetical protein